MPQTILITGAAKRIGKAMALHFALKGWHVAAHYGAAQAEAQLLEQEVKAQGGTLTLFQADFTQEHAAQKLFDAVVQQCGAPDVLINNAARFERDDGGITKASLDAHMAVNAAAPIILAQNLIQQHKTGFIFNILDRTLDWSWPHLPAYVLSKRALEEWTTRNASVFLTKVHIYGLRLGPTVRNPRESEAHFIKAVATQRATEVEDILQTIDRALENPSRQPILIDL